MLNAGRTVAACFSLRLPRCRWFSPKKGITSSAHALNGSIVDLLEQHQAPANAVLQRIGTGGGGAGLHGGANDRPLLS